MPAPLTLMAARDAVQAQLAAHLPLLRCYDTVPAIVNPPAAVITPNTGALANYEVVMSSSITEWSIRVVLIVATGVDRTAQDAMDSYISPTGTLSVPAAIRSDPSLGGVAEWAVIKSAERYGLMNYGGTDYLGCELVIEVSG